MKTYTEEDVTSIKTEEKKIADARIAERDNIMANLAHSIKNLISSVQDPLQLVSNDEDINKDNKFSIDNALKGLELIKKMAFSIDHSYTGGIEDFIYDAKSNDKDGKSIEELLLNSLIYATGNMFDRKYFEKPSFRYFIKGKKEEREMARKEYDSNIKETNLNNISNMLNKYFFTFNYECDNTVNFRLGDTKSSATKLFIMLQEIIMNSVKYASFIPKADRFLNISIKEKNENVILSVKNSMKPTSREKTTGMGHVVIANIAKMIGAKPEIIKSAEDATYEIIIEFKNLWQDKSVNYAEDVIENSLNVAEPANDYGAKM